MPPSPSDSLSKEDQLAPLRAALYRSIADLSAGGSALNAVGAIEDFAKAITDRAITSAAFELLYVDPHQWSTRPCQTCRAITALLGKSFGCDRFREGKS